MQSCLFSRFENLILHHCQLCLMMIIFLILLWLLEMIEKHRGSISRRLTATSRKRRPAGWGGWSINKPLFLYPWAPATLIIQSHQDTLRSIVVWLADGTLHNQFQEFSWNKPINRSGSMIDWLSLAIVNDATNKIFPYLIYWRVESTTKYSNRF